MIKKIRLMLEYNTYCIWLYDENDEIIDNDNPPELSAIFMIRSILTTVKNLDMSAVPTKELEKNLNRLLQMRLVFSWTKTMGNTRFKTIFMTISNSGISQI